ncbi:MAG: hypothetical protein IJ600_05505 [Lachnospiraceae bacterium]|nr:hypothetical protein [Lachnospiraceae bacterium]
MKRNLKHGKVGRFAAAVVLSASLMTAVKPLTSDAAGAADYAAVFDAGYYANANPDVNAACGGNADLLFAHFINYGMAEGRQGSAEFNVQAYRNNYPDLQAAFGNDLVSYYVHYQTAGKAEGRVGTVKAAAATNTTTTTTTTTTTSAEDKRNMSDQLRWDMQAAINKFRTSNDRVSLVNTTEIIDGAQVRADELTKKYDRIRPDGRNGDSVLEDKNVPRHYFRELIYRSGSGSVSEVINEWTAASADVRNVLLYGNWRIIGVGHREANGVHYWAIEFSDNDNVLKPGYSSESGNYLRERYKTPNETEQDEEEEWLRQYKKDHPDDDDD